VCLVVCFLLLVVCCRLANKDIYILHGRTATADFLPLRLLRDGILPRIFSEKWNFSNSNGDNGNGKTATEWWKPGIRH